MGNQAYLIRYARWVTYRGSGRRRSATIRWRGQPVVIQTDRGVELGEVLLPIDESDAVPTADRQRVVRPARPEDLIAPDAPTTAIGERRPGAPAGSSRRGNGPGS